MIREIVMAGISVGAVIALAWWIDHPKKEVGSLLAVGIFVVLIVVAFIKKTESGDALSKDEAQE